MTRGRETAVADPRRVLPARPATGARAGGGAVRPHASCGGYAAVELEVERSRVFVGRLEGGRLRLHEVHRFTTPLLRVDGALRCDVERMYGEALAGLGVAARACPGLATVGITGWGGDFGLLDARGRLLGAPFHTGDDCTDAAPSRLHARVPEAEIWAATGVGSTPSSTLVQLHAMARRRSSTLSRAARLLLLPDLLAYWLCGVQATEHTEASSTQCYDLERRRWAEPLLAQARIPLHLFPPVVAPATPLGAVRERRAWRAGIPGAQVVAPAAHGAAAAVAAIPAAVSSFAYVHAGREWRVGAITARPVKSEAVRTAGFTHQGGVEDSVCLERATTGLRLLQECRRAWAREGEAIGDDALAALAAAGAPLRAALDPDDPALRAPQDMPAAIQAACARAGQVLPEGRADLLRVVLEALAWKTRRILRSLEAQLGRTLEVVHVVGAGARNPLLCQLIADAVGRPVLAGPVDASALGNVLAQAVAVGACASWDEARALARASVSLVCHEPRQAAAWDEASGRLERAFEPPLDPPPA